MKKVLLVLVALVMLISIAACAATPPAAPAAPTAPAAPAAEAPGVVGDATELTDRTFRAAMTASPQSLDEGYSSHAHARHAAVHILEGLFTFDEAYNVIPQLADTYTVAADGLSGVMTIRRGITFHDGSPFEAEDVVASVRRFQNSPLGGTRLANVINVEATGTYEIAFTFDAPIGLPQLLAFPQRVVMLPRHVAEEVMYREMTGREVIGTGPYRLVDWTPDVRVEMERFDDFVPDDRFDGPTGLGGRRTAYFQRILLLPVTEPEARMAGLETGEFDFAEAIPITSFDRIAGNNSLVYSVVRPRWAIAVEFNHASGPASDINFRRALLHAIDKEQVMHAVAGGNPAFYRLNPSIYAPEQYFFTEIGSAGRYNNQDLDRVAAYLAAAGYNGEEVVYLVNRDFEFMYRACLVLAAQWQAAGINIRLEFSDWATQIAKAQSLEGWAINQTALSPRLDPTQLNSTLNSASVGAYGYSNPEMDALLAQLSLDKPSTERMAIWEQIQEMVWDEVIILKIGDFFELEAHSAELLGYTSFFHSRFWDVTFR